MSTSKRFSFLIPTYNRSRLVRETLDSVLNQSFKDFEVLVTDNNSTDDTMAVLLTYGDRIRILTQENHGPEPARHNAAAVATGEYLVLLDSDDLLLPDTLAIYDRIIRQCNEPPVIIGAMKEFTDGNPIPTVPPDWPEIEVAELENFYERKSALVRTSSQIVIKHSVARAAQPFRPTKNAFPFDTADILLRLGSYGPWIVVHRPCTLAYRLHATNAIKDLDSLIHTMPVLLRNERLNDYPGGAALRRERIAYIGDLAWEWGRKTVKHRRLDLSFFLVVRSGLIGPLFARIMRKIRQRLNSTPYRVRQLKGNAP